MNQEYDNANANKAPLRDGVDILNFSPCSLISRRCIENKQRMELHSVSDGTHDGQRDWVRENNRLRICMEF